MRYNEFVHLSAKLILEDGSEFEGVSFGKPRSCAGEVVFTTAMTGYPQALTDPSFKGQILVFTYPMIGNYGIPLQKRSLKPLFDKDYPDIPLDLESAGIKAAGVVVAEHCVSPSHHASQAALTEWLSKNGVPAISGVDTRALTKRLREHGVMRGKIIVDGAKAISFSEVQKPVPLVSCKELKRYKSRSSQAAPLKIALIDCGVKSNILRLLLNKGVEIIRVPWNCGLEGIEYDGLFLSNGPGDPKDCAETIAVVRRALQGAKPVFGICLGVQLMALAAGGDTYKLRYGHRSANQPCIEAGTGRCFITSQNHGYAVRAESLSADWEVWFTNANDGTVEGIRHKHKPFSAVQFHPEGYPGPQDTEWLIDKFLKEAAGSRLQNPESRSANPEPRPLKKVLLLGSGGLKIGQAGEFDYSGSQALKALREEGVASALINPNIATIQTSRGMADATYFLPVTPEFVTKVIEKEKPDGLLLSFGGQTALNCGVELERSGILAKYGVRVLGTPVKTIEDTEDRELFVKRLSEIGALTPRSIAVTSAEDAAPAAKEIGYPVMLRAAYALGGSGSGLCRNEKELRRLAARAFAVSPQVLIEEWLGGWKEIEYEVVRDGADNCITVCNMENFDPLGVHTGESIVIAPSQTLSDSEYHKLRRIAINVIRHLGIVGECNIQYALDPKSENYRIIEVNARLSRSSALASKATGYPLAWVAAKIALGYTLPEIENRVTRVTKACFEPALDYCVVKVPRWDLAKFRNVERRIGSEMKSVGEVMSIGRNFEEALQKALRMTGTGAPGLAGEDKWTGLSPQSKNAPGRSAGRRGEIRRNLRAPTDRRPFVVYSALQEGWSVNEIHRETKIDKWFLEKMANIAKTESEIKASCGGAVCGAIPVSLLKKAKQQGFSDARIAQFLGKTENDVRKERMLAGILPCVKQIDTLAAEYPAKTNYLYMTYNGNRGDVEPSGRQGGVCVLGSGAYRIGSSVEFDWCCVNAVNTARKLGRETIMVNCNPETVSTDYDMCDRLYFEELSLERVLDIWEAEKPEGMILSMGGQTPNNLAVPLAALGVRIFGTDSRGIDKAEDRNKFSGLLDVLHIEQPEWAELTDAASAAAFARKAGYPVLIRPSYVLSGAAMNVAWDDASLENCLSLAAEVSAEHPVVISKFVENSKEIEIDAVAKNGEILYSCITEHIENAGVHSGDATVTLPAQRLYIETIRNIRKISGRIALALNITGPFNIQFLAQRGRIRVIECNLRASRSFPFCSKVTGVNMIELASLAMLGENAAIPAASSLDLGWVGVKAAQFSYSRLRGADPVSGVEMASTGEVGCIGENLHDAFLKALLSVGYKIPKKSVLLSTGALSEKIDFLDSAQKLVNLGYELYASKGTADFLSKNGVKVTPLFWPLDSHSPNISDYIKRHKIDMIINIPKNNGERELKNDFIIRRMAVDFDIPLFTNIKCAKEFVDALGYYKANAGSGGGIEIKAWEEYLRVQPVVKN